VIDFFQFLVSGLVMGSIYALVAMGFVLIYKSTSVLNFAQGEFLMVGAYICLNTMLSFQIHFVWAFVLTMCFSVVLGMLVEILILRPLTGEPIISVIMATIGLSSILRGLVIAIWGNDIRPFPEIFPPEPYVFYGIVVDHVYLWSVGGALLLMIAFGIFFKVTRMGTAMRAVADDQQAAQTMGIRVKRVFALAWCISAVVSAIGGILIAFLNGVGMPLAHFGLKVFPAVILGGLDSIVGAVIGGLIVGVLENLSGGYLDPIIPASTQVAPFVILVLILMIKPYGLFGTHEIERV
jgi:branched-chain amino acid transport system permease protein